MIAYKLMTKRKDGSLGPLFINRRQRIPLNKWLPAEEHKTKGYAFRPGWHVTKKPIAPHLKMRDNRVWCKVEVTQEIHMKRPSSQGGSWFIAGYMRVIEETSYGKSFT